MMQNISDFLKKHKDSDYFTVRNAANEESHRIDKMCLKRNLDPDTKFELESYRDYITGFAFFLNETCTHMPASFDSDKLNIFKPIIENLVKKGNLKASALLIFK